MIKLILLLNDENSEVKEVATIAFALTVVFKPANVLAKLMPVLQGNDSNMIKNVVIALEQCLSESALEIDIKLALQDAKNIASSNPLRINISSSQANIQSSSSSSSASTTPFWNQNSVAVSTSSSATSSSSSSTSTSASTSSTSSGLGVKK